MVKLHLGCGQNYLDGYVNVDLPTEGQTIMEAKADIYQDIRELAYAPGEVDEVRNHHLLEHFSRQEALKLILQWSRWLKTGGRLVIETPDFETAFAKFTDAPIETKFKIARHIFGSQENDWAFHKDWWGKEKFTFVLEKLGFKIVEIKNNTLHMSKYFPDRFAKYVAPVIPSQFDFLDNIVVTAEKLDTVIDERAAVRDILSRSLIGKDEAILDVWMSELWND